MKHKIIADGFRSNGALVGVKHTPGSFQGVSVDLSAITDKALIPEILTREFKSQVEKLAEDNFSLWGGLSGIFKELENMSLRIMVNNKSDIPLITEALFDLNLTLRGYSYSFDDLFVRDGYTNIVIKEQSGSENNTATDIDKPFWVGTQVKLNRIFQGERNNDIREMAKRVVAGNDKPGEAAKVYKALVALLANPLKVAIYDKRDENERAVDDFIDEIDFRRGWAPPLSRKTPEQVQKEWEVDFQDIQSRDMLREIILSDSKKREFMETTDVSSDSEKIRQGLVNFFGRTNPIEPTAEEKANNLQFAKESEVDVTKEGKVVVVKKALQVESVTTDDVEGKPKEPLIKAYEDYFTPDSTAVDSGVKPKFMDFLRGGVSKLAGLLGVGSKAQIPELPRVLSETPTAAQYDAWRGSSLEVDDPAYKDPSSLGGKEGNMPGN